MSDRNWLSAMARYPDDNERGYFRDIVVGGARQLASVLQVQAKENPLRFVALMESMQPTLNAAYAEAILCGVRDGAADGSLTARGIKAAMRWSDADMGRTINWAIQKHPGAAKDPEALATVLSSAEFGSASDTTVRNLNLTQTPPTSVRELLERNSDYVSSGLNGERGSAFEALAQVLWDDADIDFSDRGPCRTSGRSRASNLGE